MPPSNFPWICYAAHQTFPKCPPSAIRCEFWNGSLTSGAHSPDPQGSPGLLPRRSLAWPPDSVHTEDPEPGSALAPEPAPRLLRVAARTGFRGPARRAAVFAPQPACAAIPHSPAGGAAAAPATGGGVNEGAGGRDARAEGAPPCAIAPPCPHRFVLLAPLHQFTVVRPEFVPLSVSHLSELLQQSALL